MRGRKPRPTHLKLVDGNPGKRKLNRQEPVPKNKLLVAPDGLTDDQQASWDYYLGNSPRGMLKALDRDLLLAYITAANLHREAAIKLQHGPLIIKSPSGIPVQSPYLKILNTQARLIASLGSELGFSPAARSRISVQPEDVESDPTDRFFDDFMDD